MKAQLKSKAKVSSSRGPRGKPSRLTKLIDALRNAPDSDDDVRLVIADAFEEEGRLDRAELVRLQVAVARGRADAVMVARAEGLQADRDRALSAYATRWASDRGFVWWVEARLDDLLAHGTELFEAEPVTSLKLADPRADLDDDIDLVAQLAEQRWLEHVRWIEFPRDLKLRDAEVIELLESPHLRNLYRLSTAYPRTAIAAAKHCTLPQLRSLFVHARVSHSEPFGDEIIEAFANRTLWELELSGCTGFTAETMRLIAQTGWKLDRLSLELADLRAGGMRVIAESPAFASLEELVLYTCQLDDDAMRALAESPHLRNLHTLKLATNYDITDDGVAMLAGSPVLASVRKLDLAGTQVTETGLATLPDHVELIPPA